jgi:hypothetical protein
MKLIYMANIRREFTVYLYATLIIHSYFALSGDRQPLYCVRTGTEKFIADDSTVGIFKCRGIRK